LPSNTPEEIQVVTAAGERAGQIEDHPDLDLLLLGIGGNRHAQRHHHSQQPAEQVGSPAHRHKSLPDDCVVWFLYLWRLSHW
jgi:hypothetical protein